MGTSGKEKKGLMPVGEGGVVVRPCLQKLQSTQFAFRLRVCSEVFP